LRTFEQVIYRTAVEREVHVRGQLVYCNAAGRNYGPRTANRFSRVQARIELLTTGRLSLPMREPERAYLLDVRRGLISEQECSPRQKSSSAN
jgi:hypothetical protein